MSDFGTRMKAAREEVGLTQTQLADAIGTRPNVIWRYETGESTPRTERLYEIAALLRCDAGWLLTGEEPADSSTEAKLDYPEFTAFLATKLGKSATEEEVAILRSMVFAKGRPTGDVYQAMLIALRGSR